MITLRILILADDALSRAGLAVLLAGQPGFAVTGQVASSADLAGSLAAYQPDVVLWDLGWEPGRLLARLADVREAVTAAGAQLAVMLPGAEYASEAWASGARALLSREVATDRLVAGLAAASQGLAVLDPALSGALAPARMALPSSPAEALTPREIDVLRLLAEGLPNKAIARGLGISEHTVKFHVNAILGKLGVESRTEAVVRATRLGLILL
jgi:DNA-binding NarL/FixJ family response regulator